MSKKSLLRFTKQKQNSEGKIHKRIKGMIKEHKAVLWRDCMQNSQRRSQLH